MYVVLKFVWSRPKGLGELVCKSKIECKLRVYILRVLYRLEVCARAILKAYVLYNSKFKFSKRATKFDEIVQLI